MVWRYSAFVHLMEKHYREAYRVIAFKVIGQRLFEDVIKLNTYVAMDDWSCQVTRKCNVNRL